MSTAPRTGTRLHAAAVRIGVRSSIVAGHGCASGQLSAESLQPFWGMTISPGAFALDIFFNDAPDARRQLR